MKEYILLQISMKGLNRMAKGIFQNEATTENNPKWEELIKRP